MLQVARETPQTLRWFDRQGRELGTPLEGLAEPITFEEEFLHWLTSVPLLE